MTYHLTSCLRYNHAEPETLNSLVCSTLSIEIALSKRKWIDRLVVVGESASMVDLQRVMHICHHSGLRAPVRADLHRANSERSYRL